MDISYYPYFRNSLHLTGNNFDISHHYDALDLNNSTGVLHPALSKISIFAVSRGSGLAKSHMAALIAGGELKFSFGS